MWKCRIHVHIRTSIDTYIVTLHPYTSEYSTTPGHAGNQCRWLCSRYVAEIVHARGLTHLWTYTVNEIWPQKRSSDRQYSRFLSIHTKTSYPHRISRSSIYFPSNRNAQKNHTGKANEIYRPNAPTTALTITAASRSQFPTTTEAPPAPTTRPFATLAGN